MDMYIRMYDELKKSPDDNPTLGIVLCSETDEDIARYSILHGNEQLFASKYKLYLPTEEELREEIEAQKAVFYLQQKETERIRKRKAMKTGARQSFRSFYSNCVKIFRNVSGSLVASKTNRMNVASLPQKRKHPVIMPCKKSFMKWRKRRLMRRYRKKFSNIFKRN